MSGHTWDESGERCLKCGDKDWMASESCLSRNLEKYQRYCPICGRVLLASNITEVAGGHHDRYIFTHDDVPHRDDEISALTTGVQ